MTGTVQSRLVACAAFFLAFNGCATAPKTARPASIAAPEPLAGKNDPVAPSEPVTITPSAVVSGQGTPLEVPSREQLRKNGIDSAALGYLEIGSPESIRKAVERINADARGMTDENRVLLAVGAELMKILYPLEPMTWPVPSVPDTGSYVGAIKSARMGAYDYNTGNTDFLSEVLPSLVLAVTDAPGEYYADSEAALLRASARNPRSVLPPYLLAVLSLRQGKKEAAQRWYEKAWDADPSCYPAGVGLARALLAQGNGAGAYEVSLALSERYPDSQAMSVLCAESAFATRDWDLADPLILKVLKGDPGNAAFLLMRARILVERKEYLKASSLLDAFATRNKTDRDYLILKSRVLREWNKNLVDVIAVLKEAQQRYPDDIEVLLATAEVCYETSQTINGLSGRELVRSVLAREPENRLALSLLVADAINTADWAEAVRTGEILYRVAPSDQSKMLLARACLGAGQGGRAVSLSRDLYARQSSDEKVAGLYLRALIATGDAKSADDLIQSRLPGAAPSLKSVLHYYASLLVSDPDSRLAALRSSLLSDPRNIQSLFAMYEWYFGRKDYRKAQYYLKQVIALEPSNAAYIRHQAKLDDLLAR